MKLNWTCHCCGEQQDELPLDIFMEFPDPWLDIPPAERSRRGIANKDVCLIDDKWFFLRGCIEIPVVDLGDLFIWGVWVSLSSKSFERVKELWSATALDDEPAKFGWLCNRISAYPDTYALPTNVRLRSGNLRPLIELKTSDHPLAIEQRDGITRARVEEIAGKVLHRRTTGA
jgi:hypothetical protein